MRDVIGLVAAVGLVVLAACASREATIPRRPGASDTVPPPVVGHTGTASPATVPWVNRPAPPYRQPTQTTAKYPTGARSCHVADLRVTSGGVGAAGASPTSAWCS